MHTAHCNIQRAHGNSTLIHKYLYICINIFLSRNRNVFCLLKENCSKGGNGFERATLFFLNQTTAMSARYNSWWESSPTLRFLHCWWERVNVWNSIRFYLNQMKCLPLWIIIALKLTHKMYLCGGGREHFFSELKRKLMMTFNRFSLVAIYTKAVF